MNRDWVKIFSAVDIGMLRGEVPKVHFDLHNAISSLQSKRPRFWDFPQEMQELLDVNPGVAEILNRYNNDSIVHAIRAVRYAASAR